MQLSPVLASLHWLPVKSKIEFKILLTALRFHPLLTAAHWTASSSYGGILVTPKVSKIRSGGKTFSWLTPLLWNRLPQHTKVYLNVYQYFYRYLYTNINRHVYLYLYMHISIQGQLWMYYHCDWLWSPFLPLSLCFFYFFPPQAALQRLLQISSHWGVFPATVTFKEKNPWIV